MPAVVDTDDGMFVVKFRGAGQGPKALIAEIICGMIAASLGLPMPELALVEIPEQFGRGEPDPEIQDVLRASHGLNVGLRYLDGAFNFALAAARDLVDPAWASRVVWLDTFLTNPDRTHRNTNILVWERRLWLIDHGAAIYAQHDWARVDEAKTRAAFPLIKDHVLLGVANDLEGADRSAMEVVTDEVIGQAVDAVPDELFAAEPVAAEFPTSEAARRRYRQYLGLRVAEPRAFVSTALEAQRTLLSDPAKHLSSRR